MKIVLIHNGRIPVQSYEDAERVLWWLGKALNTMGHELVFIVKKGSVCPFGHVIFRDEKLPLSAQIPTDCDLVHFHDDTLPETDKPFLISCYDNYNSAREFHPNTVFLSANHAKRHQGSVFVHPGIDFEEYGAPFIAARRMYFHFLGNAAWSGKNVRGAIDLASQLGARLHVIGGNRVNFRKGLRITLSPSVRFHGTLMPEGRNAMLNSSKGLIFPVIWNEPFGLAVAESLYFGCPIFGTPHGALPEVLGQKAKHKSSQNGVIEAYYCDYGCLSVKKSELLEALKNADSYDRQKCHDYAVAHFSAEKMAQNYLHLYEKILAGYTLHPKAFSFEGLEDNKSLPFSA
jgi:glycosyltransferase involved in cell wall biosynthesis